MTKKTPFAAKFVLNLIQTVDILSVLVMLHLSIRRQLSAFLIFPFKLQTHQNAESSVQTKNDVQCAGPLKWEEKVTTPFGIPHISISLGHKMWSDLYQNLKNNYM